MKDKAEGSFVIRDSRTFAGHFALALKVSETPGNTTTSRPNGQTPTAGESHQMSCVPLFVSFIQRQIGTWAAEMTAPNDFTVSAIIIIASR